MNVDRKVYYVVATKQKRRENGTNKETEWENVLENTGIIL